MDKQKVLDAIDNGYCAVARRVRFKLSEDCKRTYYVYFGLPGKRSVCRRTVMGVNEGDEVLIKRGEFPSTILKVFKTYEEAVDYIHQLDSEESKQGDLKKILKRKDRAKKKRRSKAQAKKLAAKKARLEKRAKIEEEREQKAIKKALRDKLIAEVNQGREVPITANTIGRIQMLDGVEIVSTLKKHFDPDVTSHICSIIFWGRESSKYHFKAGKDDLIKCSREHMPTKDIDMDILRNGLELIGLREDLIKKVCKRK